MIKTDPSIVSAGIGPLHCSTDCIILGILNKRLKNMTLICEKMKITFLTLPIFYKHEKKIFNDFCGVCPNANDASRKALAKLFLDKTNCTAVFTKLLSILKACEKK